MTTNQGRHGRRIIRRLHRRIALGLLCGGLLCGGLQACGAAGPGSIQRRKNATFSPDSQALSDPATSRRRTQPARPTHSKTLLRLAFRTPALASKLAALRACLRAGGRPRAPGCAPLRSRLGRRGQDHLRAFGAVRSRFLRTRRRPRPRFDPVHPLAASLLPTAQLLATEAFAEPFFRFAHLDAVLADLRLPRADAVRVRATFAWFSVPLDRLVTGLRSRAPEAALAATARWARLDLFLTRMARFYGVSGQFPTRLSVDLIWAPRDHSRATAWSGRAVVPVNHTTFPPGHSPGQRFDRAALVRTLGVVVHEFGHVFAAALPYARRLAMTDRIVGEVGVLNRRHPNVLEEAVQTALGQVIFVRSVPIRVPLGARLYAHEVGHTYPAAIDHLARQLAPTLASLLDVPAGFDGPGLDAALTAQVRRFGRPPLAFARACWVWSDTPTGLKRWRGAWSGLRRRLVDLTRDSPQRRLPAGNPWLTRWLVSIVSPAPWRGLVPASPALAAARACVRGGARACFVPRRRAAAKGWDLAVAARDERGLVALLREIKQQQQLNPRTLGKP